MIASLSTRLVAGVALIAVLAVIAVAAAARHGTKVAFIQFREAEQAHAHHLARTNQRLRDALDSRCCVADAVARALQEIAPEAGFLVISEDGSRLIAYAGRPFADVRDVSLAREQGGLAITISRGGQRMTIAVPSYGERIRLADGTAAYVRGMRLPTQDELTRISAFYGSLDRRLLAATSLVGLLVVGLAWVVSRRIVRPVTALSDASRALARGELARRVPVTGSDEIADLARSFNAMAAELERQETVRRNLMTDVAHELRSPLTSLRCRIESVIDGMVPGTVTVARELHEEVLHLGRLVDDLQELSILEARDMRLVIEPVAVAPVVHSALRAAGLERDARVRVSVCDELQASADATRFRQILLNLLTNAARYTPPDGEITLDARQESGEVLIEVRNTGSSLDAEQRARVFDRFYRTDPARQRSTGGAGLGLSIVKTLVEALGGRVWVDSTDDAVRFGIALRAA